MQIFKNAHQMDANSGSPDAKGTIMFVFFNLGSLYHYDHYVFYQDCGGPVGTWLRIWDWDLVYINNSSFVPDTSHFKALGVISGTLQSNLKL